MQNGLFHFAASRSGTESASTRSLSTSKKNDWNHPCTFATVHSPLPAHKHPPTFDFLKISLDKDHTGGTRHSLEGKGTSFDCVFVRRFRSAIFLVFLLQVDRGEIALDEIVFAGRIAVFERWLRGRGIEHIWRQSRMKRFRTFSMKSWMVSGNVASQSPTVDHALSHFSIRDRGVFWIIIHNFVCG